MRQHYIPKSYLRNFSLKDKLEAYSKKQNKSIGEVGINNICIEKNLYTIPNVPDDSKYKLEEYYANEIDSLYPEIHDLLVNEKVSYITTKQRVEIILTSLALYFRTPKSINAFNELTDKIFEDALRYADKDGIVRLTLDDEKIEFHKSEIEIVKKENRVRNKFQFLTSHLKYLHKLVDYKLKCGLSVFKIVDDFELITSDNPVTIRSVQGRPFNLFDPTNIINIPIDRKYFLTIFPNAENGLTDRLFRGNRDKWFALTTNYSVVEHAEDWLLGYPGAVSKYFLDMATYDKVNEDNLMEVSRMKERAKQLHEVLKIAESVGGDITNSKFVNYIRKIKKKNLNENDPDIQDFIIELARRGHLTI